MPWESFGFGRNGRRRLSRGYLRERERGINAKEERKDCGERVRVVKEKVDKRRSGYRMSSTGRKEKWI